MAQKDQEKKRSTKKEKLGREENSAKKANGSWQFVRSGWQTSSPN